LNKFELDPKTKDVPRIQASNLHTKTPTEKSKRLNPSPETQTIAEQKTKKKEEKWCCEEEEHRPPLLKTPAEKSRPGLAGSLQLKSLYRRLSYTDTSHLSTTTVAITPKIATDGCDSPIFMNRLLFTRVSSNGDKGQQVKKTLLFSLC
jgi:hypothetical protein